MRFISNKFLIISFSIFSIVINSGCKKEGCTNPLATNYDADANKDDGSCILPADTSANVEIRFVPTMNGAPLQMNQVFTGPNNLRMSMEAFKFYLSALSITNSAGSVISLSPVELLDFTTNGRSLFYHVEPGNYSDLNFGIGVDNPNNGTNDPNYNPAQWPDSSPLSIYNGMYWTWASGYIFTKLEGRIDTSAAQNQPPDLSWFYHIGTDTTYQEKSIDNLNISVENGQVTVIQLGIEVNELFRTDADTINMVDDYFTHTTDHLDLALKVIRNMRQAIRKL